MDCCVCGPMAPTYRHPRNNICPNCYGGARSLNSLIKKLEDGNQSGASRLPDSPMNLSDMSKWMEEGKKLEEEKMDFLRVLSDAFREGFPTDILIQPAFGPPIPAHKVLLESRSEIFRTMLESDRCKAPVKDIISLPDLSHEELQCLLDFFYVGTLPDTTSEKHIYTLLMASDKYHVPYLKKFCETRLLRLLNPSNALEILEVSEICSSHGLKKNVLDLIEIHKDEIVFSSRYDVFAIKNPHLSVEITRMLARR